MILISFFKLDFESIQTYADLMKKINISINDYKRKYNNIKNVLFFEDARDKIDNYLINRPYSLRQLLNINEDNENIEEDYQSQNQIHEDEDEDEEDDNIIEESKNYNLPTNVNDLTQESLSKLYNTFNMEYNSLSIDTLEKSYMSLKTRILNSNTSSISSSQIPSSEQLSLLKYINASYQLLRKYIINRLYGT
jgi:hypothetical protein